MSQSSYSFKITWHIPSIQKHLLFVTLTIIIIESNFKRLPWLSGNAMALQKVMEMYMFR